MSDVMKLNMNIEPGGVEFCSESIVNFTFSTDIRPSGTVGGELINLLEKLGLNLCATPFDLKIAIWERLELSDPICVEGDDVTPFNFRQIGMPLGFGIARYYELPFLFESLVVQSGCSLESVRKILIQEIMAIGSIGEMRTQVN